MHEPRLFNPAASVPETRQEWGAVKKRFSRRGHVWAVFCLRNWKLNSYRTGHGPAGDEGETRPKHVDVKSGAEKTVFSGKGEDNAAIGERLW